MVTGSVENMVKACIVYTEYKHLPSSTLPVLVCVGAVKYVTCPRRRENLAEKGMLNKASHSLNI